MTERLALLILDGFGINDDTPLENSITQAGSKQTFDGLFSTPNYTHLEASGRAVGLLDGFMGNSEVGHMTIGSGQIVKQSLLEINDHFEAGTFSALPAWQEFLASEGALHLAGMIGFAGVHAYQKHLYELIRLIPSDRRVFLHLWTDGRDSGIEESRTYMGEILAFLQDFPNVSIASIGGRYFAMDRDNNWTRTERAYRAMCGENPTTLSPEAYMQKMYDTGTYDEFIEPAFFVGQEPIRDGNAVLVFNFRPDRGRQMTELLAGDTSHLPAVFTPPRHLHVFTMTKFYDGFPGKVLIDRHTIEVTLASVISDAGLRQLHLAETEKFAHVTRYFNGIRTEPFPGEEHTLVPSHKVEGGYDRDPDMSADEILAVFREKSDDFDFYVINLANGDMVGHSGKLEAGAKAVEALDRVVQDFIRICDAKNIALCITADHGNCENMGDTAHPQTAHTTNPVPFWYISHGIVQPTLPTGGLVDVAPTVLAVMKMPIPQVMEGKSLLR